MNSELTKKLNLTIDINLRQVQEINLLKEEIILLKDIAKSYKLSFETEKRIFDNTLTELKQENKRLHSYNEQRWNL